MLTISCNTTLLYLQTRFPIEVCLLAYGNTSSATHNAILCFSPAATFTNHFHILQEKAFCLKHF